MGCRKAKGNPRYEVMGVTRYWRFSKENMEELIRQGRVIQTKPGNVPAYKRYLDEMPGVPLQNIWDDILPIGAQAAERLGYPTQKPVALLERILSVSSKPGDVVLDPFCGCGTTIHAAQKLKRHWIGIDITHLAISLIEKRLKDAFPNIRFDVHGTPKDLDGARALAEADKYQFQWWAVSLVDAVPYAGKKKGADTGIDGWLARGKCCLGGARVSQLAGVLRRTMSCGLFVNVPVMCMGNSPPQTRLVTAGGQRSSCQLTRVGGVTAYAKRRLLPLVLCQGKHDS